MNQNKRNEPIRLKVLLALISLITACIGLFLVTTRIKADNGSIAINGESNTAIIGDNIVVGENNIIDNSVNVNNIQNVIIDEQTDQVDDKSVATDLHELVEMLSNEYLEMYDLDTLIDEYGVDKSFEIAWYLRNYYYAQEA